MTSMFDDDGDISMLGYWLNGDRLVTRDLALSIATHLVLIKFGKAYINEQLPFSISETETRWQIVGSKILSERAVPSHGPIFGPVEIVISKKDCRVLSFVVHGDFAVSE